MAAEIGSEGADAAHANAEGVERLSEGTEEHVGGELGEVGLEKELYACPRVWKEAR